MYSFTFPLDIEGWGWKICPQEGQMDQVRQLDAGQEGSSQKETPVCSFLTWVGLLSRVVTDRLYSVSMALRAQFPKLISQMCTVITSPRQLISLRSTDARRESSCMVDVLTLRGQTCICHFLPTFPLTSRVSHSWILRSNLKGPDGLLRPTPSLLWARDYY